MHKITCYAMQTDFFYILYVCITYIVAAGVVDQNIILSHFSLFIQVHLLHWYNRHPILAYQPGLGVVTSLLIFGPM